MNRNIDNLGRVVIPKPMRKQLDIKNNDLLNIELQDNKIIITKPDAVDYKAILKEIEEIINKPWELADYDDGKQEHKYKKEILDLINKELK